MSAKRRLRGSSLMEVMTATMLTATVLITSVAVLVYAYYAWIKGASHVMAEADSALAVQTMDRQLREAMSVTVDTNGDGITYELPALTSSGEYTVPEVWDNVTRRIALSGTSLMMTGSDGSSETLARNVSLTDPLSTSQAAYPMFSVAAGQTITTVTVMLVTTQFDGHQNLITSRSRQTIYLRNLPQQAH